MRCFGLFVTWIELQEGCCCEVVALFGSTTLSTSKLIGSAGIIISDQGLFC